MEFEFLISKRPVSLQTKNRANLQNWKRFVRTEAERIWGTKPAPGEANLHLTLVYLCGDAPVDIDNIIKPIQDALIGLVYDDDKLVCDVQGHRRHLQGTFDPIKLPALVMQGVLEGQECVYVRVVESVDLEELL